LIYRKNLLHRKNAGDKALTDHLKLRIYPAIVGILGLCLAASLLSHFEVQIFTEPAPLGDRPDSTAVDLEEGRASSGETASGETVPDLVSASSSPLATNSPAAVVPPESSQTAAPIAPSASQVGHVGSLRVSNPTLYPVRVALLPLETASKQPASGANPQKAAIQPVHWDFAPDEGSAKGLKLSLPDGNLQLQDGDVLVAFAQDGSRRYWGPFVVGKTALPLWNSAAQEWQLRLQP
jgi:hypothetical protein